MSYEQYVKDFARFQKTFKKITFIRMGGFHFSNGAPKYIEKYKEKTTVLYFADTKMVYIYQRGKLVDEINYLFVSRQLGDIRLEDYLKIINKKHILSYKNRMIDKNLALFKKGQLEDIVLTGGHLNLEFLCRLYSQVHK